MFAPAHVHLRVSNLFRWDFISHDLLYLLSVTFWRATSIEMMVENERNSTISKIYLQNMLMHKLWQ